MRKVPSARAVPPVTSVLSAALHTPTVAAVSGAPVAASFTVPRMVPRPCCWAPGGRPVRPPPAGGPPWARAAGGAGGAGGCVRRGAADGAAALLLGARRGARSAAARRGPALGVRGGRRGRHGEGKDDSEEALHIDRSRCRERIRGASAKGHPAG